MLKVIYFSFESPATCVKFSCEISTGEIKPVINEKCNFQSVHESKLKALFRNSRTIRIPMQKSIPRFFHGVGLPLVRSFQLRR